MIVTRDPCMFPVMPATVLKFNRDQVLPENSKNPLFAERISERASILSLSQSDIARRLGIRPQSVQQWFEGETVPRTTRLKELAAVLKTSVTWLLGGASSSADANTSSVESRGTEVPLISWVQAGQWASAEDPYPVGAAEETVRTFANVGQNAFALRVHGDSMEPLFPDGSVIIVDPGKEARHGSYVVVRLEADAEATFKQLVIDGPSKYLKPVNPRYPIMRIDADASICGVVVRLERDFS